MAQRLTKRLVESIQPDQTREQWITDADVPGFALRVTPAGSRLYVVRYRWRGKLRKLPLGRHGQLTVEQARQKARDAFAALAAGRDPAAGTGDGPTIMAQRRRNELRMNHSRLMLGERWLLHPVNQIARKDARL